MRQVTTTRERVLALRAEGWRRSDIAREVGVSTKRVGEILARVPLVPVYVAPNTRARMIELAAAAGLTVSAYLEELTP